MDAVKISARNVFKGRVKKVVPGAVNCEVVLSLPEGLEITAVITKSSVARLGLKKGKEAYAVVKSTSVLVAVD